MRTRSAQDFGAGFSGMRVERSSCVVVVPSSDAATLAAVSRFAPFTPVDLRGAAVTGDALSAGLDFVGLVGNGRLGIAGIMAAEGFDLCDGFEVAVA